MGKKIKCSSTPRERKSKDQGGKKSKVMQLYTPLQFLEGVPKNFRKMDDLAVFSMKQGQHL